MKTKIKKLLFASGAALLLCGCIDCGPFPEPEISTVDVELDGIVNDGSPIAASDLRLRLSLGVIYVTQRVSTLPLIDTAYACSPADPTGFDNEIVTLSLTCDKPVRGFSPGQNILTTSSTVNGGESGATMTLGQWFKFVNHGFGYGDPWYDDKDIYNIYIAFIPDGTQVPPGDYTFKFLLERENGARYEKQFSPLNLK